MSGPLRARVADGALRARVAEGARWRWRVLAAQWPRRSAAAIIAHEEWGWGGATFETVLPRDRRVRVTVQPDGDVLLRIPSDCDAADTAQVAALLAAATERLREGWIAAQSGRLGALLVLVEAAVAGTAVVVPGGQVLDVALWVLGGGAAFPWGSMLWAGGAAALPFGARRAVGFGRGWVVRRFTRGGV